MDRRNIKYISDYSNLPKDYKADIILFAFKPQGAEAILADLVKNKPYHDNSIFTSILAGKKIDFFENILGSNKKILRLMPNLPIVINKGILVIFLIPI